MRTLTLIIALLSSLKMFSQNTGYLGKKTTVDFNMVGNYVLIPNMIQKKKPWLPKYKSENGTLVESLDRFDYGGEINISHVVSRKIALGVCMGYDVFSVGLFSNSFQFNKEIIIGQHEQITVNGLYILPTISFAHKTGSLPMGIIHELGIGYRMDTPVEKDYLYSYHVNLTSEPSTIDINSFKFYNFSHRSYNSVPIFYSVRFRYALNNFIFFNAGMRYIMSFQNSDTENRETDEEYFHSQGDMQNAINSRRRVSMMKGFVGLTFVF